VKREEVLRRRIATEKIVEIARPPTTRTNHGSQMQMYSQTWAVKQYRLARVHINEQSQNLWISQVATGCRGGTRGDWMMTTEVGRPGPFTGAS